MRPFAGLYCSLIRLGAFMDKSSQPSSESVERVQKLFIKHMHELRGYLFPLVADRSLVDDLLHTVFLAMTADADRYDPQRSFLAWARGIARNKALMAARQSRQAPRALSPDVIELLSDDVPQFDMQQSRVDAVAECVEELAPRAKEAIRLRYFDALKPSEIAGRMTLADATVHVTLSRARSLLRRCVERKTRTEREQ